MLVEHAVAHFYHEQGAAVRTGCSFSCAHLRPKYGLPHGTGRCVGEGLPSLGGIDAVEFYAHDLARLAEEMDRVSIQHPVSFANVRLPLGKDGDSEKEQEAPEHEVPPPRRRGLAFSGNYGVKKTGAHGQWSTGFTKARAPPVRPGPLRPTPQG